MCKKNYELIWRKIKRKFYRLQHYRIIETKLTERDWKAKALWDMYL